jgi:protein TonB
MNIQEYRQGIGWTLSVVIHAVLLFTGIFLVAEAPKFSIEKTPPSVEVELFTPLPPTPPPPIVQPETTPPPVPPPPEPTPLSPPPEITPPPVVAVEEPVTPPIEKPEFIQPVPAPLPPAALVQSVPAPAPLPRPVISNAVTTSAKASYLVDPLPPYPEASRHAHEQGTVLLLVKVDASGKPTETTVKQTSGYPRLDRVAVDWIQQNYKFQPATINGLPVAAEVTIPIRFSLQ